VGAGEGNCIEELVHTVILFVQKNVILFYGNYSTIVFIFPEFLREICVLDERNA
jgi:hypothetical protein